ncbi:hypothetical protein [Bordetella sp. BOR01]|uniref:hypothetical protein n=1 Tax=Bordetella sp. BOR01 TaxID=2854779 RepID=UPI001C43EAAC|nr:hypothetical protein [Bordetella sp. BOR01]MBV7486453.1 hypothetical protein [Bordetella sp. BOR01]
MKPESSRAYQVPCRRFDQAHDQNPRLVDTLRLFSNEIGVDPTLALLALYDHNDRLWATWRDEKSRAAWSLSLDQAWRNSGGEIKPVHLLNVCEDIEFDDDDLDGSDPD